MVNSCLSRLVRQQAEKYGDKVALNTVITPLLHGFLSHGTGLLIW